MARMFSFFFEGGGRVVDLVYIYIFKIIKFTEGGYHNRLDIINRVVRLGNLIKNTLAILRRRDLPTKHNWMTADLPFCHNVAAVSWSLMFCNRDGPLSTSRSQLPAVPHRWEILSIQAAFTFYVFPPIDAHKVVDYRCRSAVCHLREAQRETWHNGKIIHRVIGALDMLSSDRGSQCFIDKVGWNLWSSVL